MIEHTEHHTEDLIIQSGDGEHQEEENHFKEHLLRSSIHREEEPAQKKKSSVLDEWLLRAVPQGKENHPFLLSRLWVGTLAAGKASQNIIRPCVGKKCREFAHCTCLSAADDCYYVKRIV